MFDSYQRWVPKPNSLTKISLPPNLRNFIPLTLLITSLVGPFPALIVPPIDAFAIESSLLPKKLKKLPEAIMVIRDRRFLLDMQSSLWWVANRLVEVWWNRRWVDGGVWNATAADVVASVASSIGILMVKTFSASDVDKQWFHVDTILSIRCRGD